MERRFQTRLDELRRDARVPPGLLRGVAPRLDAFLRPFVAALTRDETRDNVGRYVRGLLSNLGAKTAEAIAYLHDRDRQGLQKFVGQSGWDHRPLLAELARQVGAELGEPDAVLAFDPSAFAKKGDRSVGVARQWCGRLGKLENCQVGVYLAYVSRRDHALVDTRLYLPREWTRRRRRMSTAGVPSGTRFRTRHELALGMLDEHGPSLPHGWVSGDDEMGRSSWFRQQLRSRGERYLLAVPSNTSVRDLTAGVPYAGRGRRPKAPFARADRWAAGRPNGAWVAVEVRDAEKGPQVVQVARGPVQARSRGSEADGWGTTRRGGSSRGVFARPVGWYASTAGTSSGWPTSWSGGSGSGRRRSNASSTTCLVTDPAATALPHPRPETASRPGQGAYLSPASRPASRFHELAANLRATVRKAVIAATYRS